MDDKDVEGSEGTQLTDGHRVEVNLDFDLADVPLYGVSGHQDERFSRKNRDGSAQGLAPEVQSFFEEQRAIGKKWPKTLYPMKYEISVYRIADTAVMKCLASVDSKDWRLRELAIRETEGAIDLIKEVLRLPLTEACKEAFKGVTVQNMEEKWAANYLNKSFHAQDIPDFPRTNPSETISEQGFFMIHPTKKAVVFSVPKAKIHEIGQKVLSFDLPGKYQYPGPIFFKETMWRVWNLIEEMFKPELACIRWLEKSDQSPSAVVDDASYSFKELTLYRGLGKELCRRLRKTDISPRLMDSLIDPYFHETQTDCIIQGIAEFVEDGTVPDQFSLSW